MNIFLEALIKPQVRDGDKILYEYAANNLERGAVRSPWAHPEGHTAQSNPRKRRVQ